LSVKEVFWRDHYDFLKQQGYTLRDRFRPDWVPSWIKDPSKEYDLCEDSVRSIDNQVMDAVRSDGADVSIKDIRLDSKFNDISVARHFSSPDLAKHPKNHCVTALDILGPPPGSQTAFLVMPLLINIDYMKFETIGEVIDYCWQILEVMVP
ncbi:hypothetical protein H0H93_001536, partial [Arthromyces matolae]